METVNDIADALKVFIETDSVTELRAFGVSGESRIGYFDDEHLLDMAKAAHELSFGCRGVYFIPNPVRPTLLKRMPNKVGKGFPRDRGDPPGGAAWGTNDSEIERRRWLLIDVDPKREKGFTKDSATEDEQKAAWTVLCNIKAAMSGMIHPVVASSGNGWHLCYPVDFPNSDSARDLFQSVLAGLAERYNTTGAEVDKKTFNASRIWKIYGTTARKGQGSPIRPHRTAFIHSTPKRIAETDRAANAKCLTDLLKGWNEQGKLFERATAPSGADKVSRAKAYLSKMPPAVSGEKGHDVTFHTVAKVVQGFALTQSEAEEALQDWNNRCDPPWGKAELSHKIKDAIRLATETGKLLNPVKPAERLKESKPWSPPLPVEYQGPEAYPEPPATGDANDEDATVADLAEQKIDFLWPGWIQKGALVVVASDAGCGKTRFCGDLARRLWFGEPWPDGQANTTPAFTRVMWLACDGQWAELPAICDGLGLPKEAVLLNSRKGNIYGGTDLDEGQHLAEFERRIARHKPALIFIDTVTNATSRSTARTEESKMFFKPLYMIAARQNVSIIALSHLNAEGKSLGRRIEGAGRQQIMIDWEDGDKETRQTNYRKIWVHKSNSMKPKPLRVNVGTAVFEYTPWEIEQVIGGAGEGPKGKKKRAPSATPAVIDCMEWIRSHLALGDMKHGAMLQAWEEDKNGSKPVFYDAKDILIAGGVMKEYQDEQKKKWFGFVDPKAKEIPE